MLEKKQQSLLTVAFGMVVQNATKDQNQIQNTGVKKLKQTKKRQKGKPCFKKRKLDCFKILGMPSKQKNRKYF